MNERSWFTRLNYGEHFWFWQDEVSSVVQQVQRGW